MGGSSRPPARHRVRGRCRRTGAARRSARGRAAVSRPRCAPLSIRKPGPMPRAGSQRVTTRSTIAGRRTRLEPLHQRVEVRSRPLGHHPHAAVRLVGHEPVEAQRHRLAQREARGSRRPATRPRTFAVEADSPAGPPALPSCGPAPARPAQQQDVEDELGADVAREQLVGADERGRGTPPPRRAGRSGAAAPRSPRGATRSRMDRGAPRCDAARGRARGRATRLEQDAGARRRSPADALAPASSAAGSPAAVVRGLRRRRHAARRSATLPGRACAGPAADALPRPRRLDGSLRRGERGQRAASSSIARASRPGGGQPARRDPAPSRSSRVRVELAADGLGTRRGRVGNGDARPAARRAARAGPRSGRPRGPRSASSRSIVADRRRCRGGSARTATGSWGGAAPRRRRTG